MAKEHFTSDFVRWKNSWTFVSRLGLLVIFTVLLLLVTSSSSFQQTNYNSEEEYSGEEYGSEEEYDSEEEEGPPYGEGDVDLEEKMWSAEEDPNYEEGLGKLLKKGQATPAGKKGGYSKPSYMFSIPDLRKLVKNEIKLYRAVKTYLLRVESRMEKMKRWVKDYEESTVKAALQLQVEEDHAEPLNKLVTNPFVSHRMVRRFSKDLENIMNLVNPYAEQSFLKEAVKTSSELHYPDVDDDYVDSMDSLLRIQHYNNYTTEDMKNGKIGHLATNITLDCVHAFDLAVHAHFNMLPNKIRTLGIEWMEMALKLYEEEGISDEKFRDEMTAKLSLMVKSHDKDWPTYRHVHSEWFFDKTIGSNFGSHLPQRPRSERDHGAKSRRSELGYNTHTRSNFRTLCSGQNIQTEAEKAKLTCWYEHTTHPYWAINPIKKEALSLEPELYQMYDILSPGAIKYLIGKAKPSMERSLVIDPEDPKKNDKSSVRTSSQTWLFENEDEPELTEISKRIEYSSGLNVLDERSSESIQIASYGSSHHYDEHVDVLVDPRRTGEKGERIATYMFYLSNVEVGGKTGFPAMGTAATPVAGSAVMWYNVKKNGDADYRTWHGGCPVVYGEKWVGNKWILAHENWNKRQCSLNSQE